MKNKRVYLHLFLVCAITASFIGIGKKAVQPSTLGANINNQITQLMAR